MDNLRDYFENTEGIGKTFFVGDGGSCSGSNDVSTYEMCKAASGTIDDDYVVAAFDEMVPIRDSGLCFVKENPNGDMQVYYRESEMTLQSGESPVCFKNEALVCTNYEQCQKWNFIIDPFLNPNGPKCGDSSPQGGMGGSECKVACCEEQENHCRLSPIIKSQHGRPYVYFVGYIVRALVTYH